MSSRKKIIPPIQEVSWWKRTNTMPPSNRLQKINIWVTIVFTLLTGLLALKTYNTATQIEGMSQLITNTATLSTQNTEIINSVSEQLKIIDLPSRPTIKAIKFDIEPKGKIADFNVTIKNFGKRAALKLTCRVWFLGDSIIYKATSVPYDFLSQDETKLWTTHLPIPYSSFYQGHYSTKISRPMLRCCANMQRP